jgi:ribosomal protein S18 acetylase RimI-like enzyme
VDVSIEEYAGPHRDLEWSFRLAEDSDEQLDSYIDLGRVWVARTVDGEVVGHLHAVERERDLWEVVNTAVAEHARGQGVGRTLLDHVVDEARTAGAARVILATATADVGNLRFYQRLGFRFRSIERDAFTPATGYPQGLLIDGIELRDRVWLDRPCRI